MPLKKHGPHTGKSKLPGYVKPNKRNPDNQVEMSQSVRCQEDSYTAVKGVLKQRLFDAGKIRSVELKFTTPDLKKRCAEAGLSSQVSREISQCRKKAMHAEGISLGICHKHLEIKIGQKACDLDELIALKMGEWKRAQIDLVSPSLAAIKRVITESAHDPSVVKAASFIIENTPGLTLPKHPTAPTSIDITQNNYSGPDVNLLSAQSLAVLTDSEQETFLHLLSKIRDAAKLALPSGTVTDLSSEGAA